MDLHAQTPWLFQHNLMQAKPLLLSVCCTVSAAIHVLVKAAARAYLLTRSKKSVGHEGEIALGSHKHRLVALGQLSLALLA